VNLIVDFPAQVLVVGCAEKVGSSMIGCRCTLPLLLGSAFVAYQSSSTSVSTIQSLIRAQQYSQALQAIQSGLRSAPRDARLWTLKGILLSIESRDQQASVAFAHALNLEPNDLAALKGEAQLAYQDHNRRAVPLLYRILALSPEDETAHEMLGNLERDAGDCQAAIHDFEQSAAAIGRHSASLEAYGSCLDRSGHTQHAISVLQQLADSFPQLPYAKYDLAVVMFDAKQYDSALKVIEPIIAVNNTDPDLLSLASDIYEAVGNTPQAVSMLREAIVLRPADANLYNAFAVLCLDHDSFQVGIDMLNAGLQRNPSQPSLYFSRGLLYAQLSEFDKAIADFETAERLNPGQGLASYAIDLAELQKYHFDVNHSDQTIKEIRAQIKLHPDSAGLHYLLAKLLSTQRSDSGKTAVDEAKSAALTALQLKPDFSEARDLLANIYLRLGDYGEAAQQCRISLQYNPSDRSAIYHLIAALRHSDQSQDRVELLTMVKRLSDLEKSSLQGETAKKKFRLVEQQRPAGQ
jgi:tetratricopeptide (TPR) repeat protein